jgi:hypothetical protein
VLKWRSRTIPGDTENGVDEFVRIPTVVILQTFFSKMTDVPWDKAVAVRLLVVALTAVVVLRL